jgi:GNAT superfamily N-acetyltransferase
VRWISAKDRPQVAAAEGVQPSSPDARWRAESHPGGADHPNGSAAPRRRGYRLSAMPTGPTVLDSAVTARPFRPDDEAGVLDVLQGVFGQWPRDLGGVTAAEFFRWKHLDGPFGPSLRLVAEADGAVIGFAAYMRWRFRAGEQTVKAVRGVDLAVHPSHRMRGVSVALRTAATFPSDVGFTWGNPNVESRPGGRRAGRRPVRIVTQFVRSPSPASTLLRASVRRNRTPRQLAVEAGPASAVLNDAPLTSLLDHAADARGRLKTERTRDYLRWRYGRFDDYRAIRVPGAGGADGVVVFRCRRHGAFWVSHICELLVEHEDRRLVRRLLQGVSDAAPVDFIRCSFASRSQAAAHGFLHCRRGLLLTTYAWEPNLLPDPTRPDSWSLSIGDLELL